MKILYVYAHPNPKSYNDMLKQSALDTFAELKCDIQISDLYADQYNAIASWEDFNEPRASLPSQYFLAQQQAFNDNHLAEDIIREMKKLDWADHIIFQFPLWWFSTPAILKGWFDRILIKGFAYDVGKVFEKGLLCGKTASLVVSTQSPEAAYQVEGVHGATIDTFLHHIHHTMRFVGIEPGQPFVTYGAFNLNPEQETKLQQEFHDYLKNIINPS